ncbi:MAG: hypothetical protein Kow0037_32520 [Calditrichia bacterium]
MREPQQTPFSTSPDFLEKLYETMNEGLIFINQDGIIEYSNPAGQRILKLTKSEFEGRTIYKSDWQVIRTDGSPMPEEEWPVIIALRKKRVAGGVVMGILKEHSETQWITVNAAPIFADNGDFLGVVCAFNDITKFKKAVDALEESETRFREQYQHLPLPTLTFQKFSDKYILVDYNEMAQQVSGEGISPLVGEPPEAIFSEDGQILNALYHPTEGKKHIRFETHEALSFDERPRYYSVQISFIPSDIVLIHFEDVTEKHTALEELKVSRQQLRNLTSYLQNVREDERKSLAREIHDELGQFLTLLKIEAYLLKSGVPENTSKAVRDFLTGGITKLTSLVDQAIQKSQQIVSDLRPPVLGDTNIVSLIEELLEQLEGISDIRFEFHTNIDELVLDEPHTLAIYRIVQEALTNCLRHSRANRVVVTVNWNETNFRICVEDNGRGMPPSRLISGNSFGIIGMRERAILLGGELDIQSKPGCTRVQLSIPLTAIKGDTGERHH